MKVYAQQREMFAFHGEEPSRKQDLVMTLLVYAIWRLATRLRTKQSGEEEHIFL